MFRLAFLFITMTTLEIFVLIKLGSFLGPWITVGLILLTGFLGASLARHQGFSVLRSIQETMQKGQIPAQELLDGVCILIAGAFLMTPGFLTDFFGFALLTPPFRRWLMRSMKKRMETWIQQQDVVFTTGQSFVYMDDEHQQPSNPRHQPLDSRGKPPYEA